MLSSSVGGYMAGSCYGRWYVCEVWVSRLWGLGLKINQLFFFSWTPFLQFYNRDVGHMQEWQWYVCEVWVSRLWGPWGSSTCSYIGQWGPPQVWVKTGQRRQSCRNSGYKYLVIIIQRCIPLFALQKTADLQMGLGNWYDVWICRILAQVKRAKTPKTSKKHLKLA